MKKRNAIAFALALLILALSGCAAAGGPADPAVISDKAVAASGASSAPARSETPQTKASPSAGAEGGRVTAQAGAVTQTAVPSAAPTADLITEAEAKSIALTHAGVKEAEANFVRAKLDMDDGRAEYEVEFWSGSTEYDYDIDAATGAVLGFDHDAEHYAPQTAAPVATPVSTAYIGESAAMSAALAHAGLDSGSVTGLYAKLDMDDGRAEYEVEFRSGNTEYEYDIDALTGAVISYDVDTDD